MPARPYDGRLIASPARSVRPRWETRSVKSASRSDRPVGLFAVPNWLRDLGTMAWLLVGITLLTVGVIWLLSLTQTIVLPVLTAAIVAAVLSPLVRLLSRRGVPRGPSAAVVLLAIVLTGALITYLVLHGISEQGASLTTELKRAADKLAAGLNDLGVSRDTAENAKDAASDSLSGAFHFLLEGLGKSLSALASLAVFLSFTVLGLFFLLKDGPMIREWGERHMGVPVPVARIITGRMLGSLRGYFVGVTVVAVFNGVLIGLGALVLGVPLAGSIMVVNFLAAYIPYLGAWSAGAFTVLLALGSQGPAAALAMVVVALLANGALQQLIQPIAFAAVLGIHPLAVLVVTVAAGSLFGTIGLVLAAPLTSAAVRIAADLAQARDGEPGGAGEPVPVAP
jgi:predicted PurR-regulated permease PerM